MKGLTLSLKLKAGQQRIQQKLTELIKNKI
jgi:hypothetical protein